MFMICVRLQWCALLVVVFVMAVTPGVSIGGPGARVVGRVLPVGVVLLCIGVLVIVGVWFPDVLGVMLGIGGIVGKQCNNTV